MLTLLQEKRQRLASRRSLTEFARSQGFEPAPHHALLVAELEALERGDCDILLVEMPPGSAKSTYVNFLFPAWCMARRSALNVLTASHSSELAERWGRRTRNLLAASATLLSVGVSPDSGAAYRWSTTSASEYYAVGVGVGIMGFRADLGIIDDPFGSREDAESKRIRDKIWEWYTNDFSSRLKPGAKRVIMHQRFHEDDLAGRIVAQLDALGKPYRRLKIRAEATDNDPLGRTPGEMLWDDPKGYDYGRFLRDRKLESDPRTWSALYQQEPTPETGDYFRREWLVPVENMPKAVDLRVYGGSDYAVTADGGDYTVHAVIGLDADETPYLLDLWRKQASSDVWVESWCDLVLKWEPLEWAEELGQIKSGVGPFLDKRARERRAYCVRSQFPTRGDKAVRAQSIRGRMAMRGLRIPAHALWRAEFEAELLRFPAGVHDDQVDALGLVGQLLDKMIGASRPKVEKPSNVDSYRSYERRTDESSGLTL
ncbi:MAG: terminase family protein [Armatimonadetes bacterium]|nr:terminase family protein [Armatimonadota bacterium]